jgi:hypothetical protein
MYNLTISTLHTYYVETGGAAVLVHNTWRCGDASDIARGHASSKHAGDFPGMSTADLESHVADVMSNPLRTKDLKRGRTAYLGRDGETIVIHDPEHKDLGTVFRRPKDGVDAYWELGLN